MFPIPQFLDSRRLHTVRIPAFYTSGFVNEMGTSYNSIAFYKQYALSYSGNYEHFEKNMAGEGQSLARGNSRTPLTINATSEDIT